jgi:L-ribulose-5-phosphate 4-epimerase
MLEALKEVVLQANLDLEMMGLVTLGWGNVSGIDRHENAVVIKPRGVACSEIRTSDMIVVDLQGRILEGNLKPSSDAGVHVALYTGFPEIEGVAHSHSDYAVMFAQARCEIPCLGTTHADYFNGPVPVTRYPSKDEVEEDYKAHAGGLILECFEELEPLEFPGVLVAGHGPYTWGSSLENAIENMLVLEKVARTAYGTISLARRGQPADSSLALPGYIHSRHYHRRHA